MLAVEMSGPKMSKCTFQSLNSSLLLKIKNKNLQWLTIIIVNFSETNFL